MDNRIEKIRELLNDPTFGEEVNNCETTEEFQAAFLRRGVEMTLEETESVLLQVGAASGEELSPEQLDQISGGGVFGGILLIGGALLVCYGVGWAVGRYLKKKSGMCM